MRKNKKSLLIKEVVLLNVTDKYLITTFFEYTVPFKFVNWFLEQHDKPGLLGEIARKCMNDPKFPTQAKHPEEVFDYLKNKKSTKKEIQTVKAAWNKYRKLGKVKAISLSVLRAKI